MSENITLRAATKSDAHHLAHLINYAGEGIPLYFWQKTAKSGEDPWEIGKSRAMREDGSFSYRNTTIAEIDGKVAGCLVTYVLDEDPEPIDYENMPPIFIPIQELEDSAPSTQYVSVLAAYPEYRNLGIGSLLLDVAEKLAGTRKMSLIVSDGNPNARRLYERLGYSRKDIRAMIKEDWKGEGENWILMVKEKTGN